MSGCITGANAAALNVMRRLIELLLDGARQSTVDEGNTRGSERYSRSGAFESGFGTEVE